jgi:hypothetical protein
MEEVFWWRQAPFHFLFFLSSYCGFSNNTDRTFLDFSFPTASQTQNRIQRAVRADQEGEYKQNADR